MENAPVSYIQLLREDLAIFRVVPEGPFPEYKAGQFLTLGLPVKSENNRVINRAYSIASHPENKKYFEFVIRWVRKPYPGRLTTAMFNLKEGDPIQWRKAQNLSFRLGNEKLTLTEYDNVTLISIPYDGKLLLISTQPTVHYHDVIQSIISTIPPWEK